MLIVFRQSDASDTYPVGTTTILWTVTDDNGRTNTCSQDITIEDNENPTITCPADQTASADVSCQFTMIDYTGLAVTNDNCDLSVDVTQSPLAGTLVSGTQTVTLTATDDDDNFSTCTFDVVVEDNTAPIITTCAPDVTQQIDANCEFDIIDYTGNIVANDNCDLNLTITQSPLVGTTISGHGTVQTVTISVEDDNTNITTCTFDITLEDSVNPTITCPVDVTQNVDNGTCLAALIILTPTTNDNCGVVSVINDFNGTSNASDDYPVGTTTVLWTVTDVNNNTATCSQTITITDDEVPIITCPIDVYTSSDINSCNATVIIPQLNVNCMIESILNDYNNTSNASDSYPIGTTIVTWVVVDELGNQTDCSFNVTVIDEEAPTIECLYDIDVSNDSGVCGAVVSFNLPNFNDNCLGTTLQQTEGLLSGDLFPVGVTTQTYLVTDAAGNEAECSFSISVNDTEDPTITCPQNIIQHDPVVFYPMPTFSDNCNATIELITGLPSNSEFEHGTTTITFQVTDGPGNSTTCSFDILVNLPPVGEDDFVEFTTDDNSIEINPIINDWDPDEDPLHITIVITSENSSYILNGNSITYIPNEDWCGLDSISYIICDSYNLCDTATVFIDVECGVNLFIPDGFSPNENGVNDYFEIIGLENYPNNSFSIYNRWGHLLYEVENYKNDWDGKAQTDLQIGNSILPKGTYFYMFQPEKNKSEIISGYIYLNY